MHSSLPLVSSAYVPSHPPWSTCYHWLNFHVGVTNIMADSSTVFKAVFYTRSCERLISLPPLDFFSPSFLHKEGKCQACLTPTDTSIPADDCHKEIDTLVCTREFNLL